MSQVATLRGPRAVVLADLIPGALARDVLLVAGGAGFVGLLAQVAVPIPGTPVPITGQTLGVLLIGAAFGWRRAAATIALYAIVGLAGVPWFADGKSGYATASFGYVIGFFLAATAAGWLAERGADRTILKALPAMLVAEVIIYAAGLPWLAVAAGLSFSETLSKGLVPFLLGDAVKAALAAGLLPAAWALTRRK
ncbi:biotin transporter BioY [Symbioplanes lichenis]|uniref:biotin transporter BioY n=1 Tax=Symbioplanes lichenis TaxID=1629072 RepID=UPI002739D721|nr:biotin transporter BioY [Actinoplanes lichenis]